MTIAFAWTRTLTTNTKELVFVSDSRYSGDGLTFDVCPKILTLPRSDSAICFAGYTGHALPMMLQLSEAIGSFDRAMRRSQDIVPLKTHVLKVFNSMSGDLVNSLGISALTDPVPEARFLFGGYSWRRKSFEIWEIFYQKSQGAFEERPAGWLTYSATSNSYELRSTETPQALGRLALIGDQGKVGYAKLIERLRSTTHIVQKLDWEPFEIVRDILRETGHSSTIGGAPQIVKVYQYMQADPIGVFWPQKKGGHATLKGRKCLGYERLGRWILDPDTLKTERWLVPNEIVEDANALQESE